jgi:hypothetical protein
VHPEIPAQCQESSYSQDATRREVKTSFAFDVESKPVDCINVLGVFLVVCLVSFCALLILSQCHEFVLDRATKLQLARAKGGIINAQ